MQGSSDNDNGWSCPHRRLDNNKTRLYEEGSNFLNGAMKIITIVMEQYISKKHLCSTATPLVEKKTSSINLFTCPPFENPFQNCIALITLGS